MKIKKKEGRGVILCHERLCNALARVSMIVMWGIVNEELKNI